jgi:tetratricopeptide (TPR) repeat protein
MSRFVASVTLIVGCLIFAATLPAQKLPSGNTDSRSLGGNVYLENNVPADHVTVELHTTSGSMIAPAITSSSGSFEFYNVSATTFSLTVDQAGYQRAEVQVDLTMNSERGINIYLKPLPGNAHAPLPTANVSAHELSMPEKARELMESGKKKLSAQKDAQGALQDFQQAVSAAPAYYEAYYQMGLAYLQLAKADDAQASFQKAIDLSGDTYGDADVGRGMILLDKGDIPNAEKSLQRGVELSPNSSRGFYELGRAQLSDGKIQDAEKSAERSRTLAPDYPAVYRLLAKIHIQAKNYPALLQDLDAYIKLDPDSPAGVRAKQMRDQVQEQLAKTTPAPAATPEP